MFDLTGKTALVTGASGGIGGAIAKALHGQGAAVVLSGTRVEALEALKSQLGRARLHRPGQSFRCRIGRSPAQGGGRSSSAARIDILVNNAGITKDNLFMRMKDEEWDQVIAVNLTAAFRLSRARAARHDEEALGPHHPDQFAWWGPPAIRARAIMPPPRRVWWA